MHDFPNQLFTSVTVTPGALRQPTLILGLKNQKKSEIGQDSFLYQLPNDPILEPIDGLLDEWKATGKIANGDFPELKTTAPIFYIELDQYVPFVHEPVLKATASNQNVKIETVEITPTACIFKFEQGTPLEAIAELVQDLCAKGLKAETNVEPTKNGPRMGT
jgi:hypothetical protein